MKFVSSFKRACLNSQSMCLIIVGTFTLFFRLQTKSLIEFFMLQTNGLAKKKKGTVKQMKKTPAKS